MNRKAWTFGTASVVLLSSLTLAGCGSSSPENTASPGGASAPQQQVTLRFSWWGSDVRHKATLAALNKYMELHPNVKIDAEYGGFDGYEQKLKTQLAGGTAPDLIQVDQPWLYDLSGQGDVFLNLNTVKDQLDLSGFDAKFLSDYTTVKNELQGLPTGLNGMVMTYNKDFFKKYGIPEDTVFDWENVMEIGKKVKAASNGQDALINVDPTTVADMFKFYVRQKNGNSFIKDDYTLGFGKTEAVEAMEHIRSFIDSGVILPFEESSAYDKKIEQFPKWQKGQLGITMNYASLIPALKKDVTFKTGVLPLIVTKDAKNTAVVTRPSQVYAINKKSKNVKETAALLNWLVNDKEAAVILGDARGTPASGQALKALEEAGKLDADIAAATTISLKTSGGPENGLTNNAELVKVRTDVIQKLAYKKLTPEQAADEMISSLNAKLKELKSSSK
ncbi:MAG: extracellular solute-binding protein family 1 [Paenibacillaceae bacterium]|jgi:oligogalacturonide transport system substrate-binding protein|nr:extracellular solute-binding protein family 1 [Paenibacillaceae bacterium]